MKILKLNVFIVCSHCISSALTLQRLVSTQMNFSWTPGVIRLNIHCVKSVLIRSFSSPYFSTFRLNTERCSVSLRIQSKIQTRKTPITDTFCAVIGFMIICKIWGKRINSGKLGFNDEWIVSSYGHVMDAFVLPPSCNGSSSTSKKR